MFCKVYVMNTSCSEKIQS